jgi:hypothetical protein
MPKRARFFTLLILAGCSASPAAAPVATPAPSVSPAGAARLSIYQRIPDSVGSYKLTQRAVVRGAPTDSLFRFSDGSRTIVTVLIYPISGDAKVGADSAKWLVHEGETFKVVQQIRRQRGEISDFSEPVSDTTRMAIGGREVLEHALVIPTRYANGAVTVEYQMLYVIDGKFLKVRATVPADDFQKSTVHNFSKQLARIVGTP